MAYAEACVFPMMHSAQSFVAVPGCFAQRNDTTTAAMVKREDAAVADCHQARPLPLLCAGLLWVPLLTTATAVFEINGGEE